MTRATYNVNGDEASLKDLYEKYNKGPFSMDYFRKTAKRQLDAGKLIGFNVAPLLGSSVKKANRSAYHVDGEFDSVKNLIKKYNGTGLTGEEVRLLLRRLRQYGKIPANKNLAGILSPNKIKDKGDDPMKFFAIGFIEMAQTKNRETSY